MQLIYYETRKPKCPKATATPLLKKATRMLCRAQKTLLFSTYVSTPVQTLSEIVNRPTLRVS